MLWFVMLFFAQKYRVVRHLISSTTDQHLFAYERDEDEELFRIVCHDCGDYADQGNEDGDEIVLVEPESFCEYLGVEEEGPEKPCGDLREEIRDLYGHICYACGSRENITVDHIVPKRMDGQAVVPKRLILALDFLMRPAPWDSYEGLIW